MHIEYTYKKSTNAWAIFVKVHKIIQDYPHQLILFLCILVYLGKNPPALRGYTQYKGNVFELHPASLLGIYASENQTSIQVMACNLFGTKPSPKGVVALYREKYSIKFESKGENLKLKKTNLEMSSVKYLGFV